MKKAFVCGWPIHHSKSPIIHQYWLNELSISGKYSKIPVEPETFSSFIRSIAEHGYVGGNVTIPHKQAAMQNVDHLDQAAREIGAVNTIWLHENKIWGGNTDWIGFVENLDQNCFGWDKKSENALVLGAGGAARAIIYALKFRGYKNIYLANRTLERAEQIKQDFGQSIIPIEIPAIKDIITRQDILVNTTSLGMDSLNPMPELILDSISEMKSGSLVTDIVYTPLETELLKTAKINKLNTVDGLGMLLHQAVPGFEKWFGVKPKVTTQLRDLVLSR